MPVLGSGHLWNGFGDLAAGDRKACAMPHAKGRSRRKRPGRSRPISVSECQREGASHVVPVVVSIAPLNALQNRMERPIGPGFQGRRRLRMHILA